MAVHKFLVKPGKGVRTLTATDIELITIDSSEELSELNSQIQSVNLNLQSRLNRYTLINSNTLLTIFSQTTVNNNVNYKLGYKVDTQDAEFRFNSVQGVLKTVKHVYINSETNNKIKFTAGQPAIQIIVPQGKLPSMTGTGKTVHAQTLRTSTSQNLVYLTGDLDDENTSIGSSTGLEAIDEGNGLGWRLVGRNPDDHGNIGNQAIDFSLPSGGDPSINGATGEFSVAFGLSAQAAGGFSIVSGSFNKGLENHTAVLGGDSNEAKGGWSGIIAGGSNQTNDINQFIGGGNNNIALLGAESSGILSGRENRAEGAYSAVLSGRGNNAKSYAEIAGGIYPTNYTPISITEFNPADRLFNIGNGIPGSIPIRSDALTILKNGTITAPSLTNSLIDNAGQKALITKEYADANYGNAETSGFGALQTLDINLRDGDLLFDDTKPLTELIPAKLNHVIVIDRIAILGDITKGVEQSYANVFLAYNKSGYNFELIEVKTDAGKQLQTDSTSWDIDNNLSDIAQSPVSAAIVLKGADGIGTTGLEGVVNIKIVYSYLDVTPILQGR